MPVILFDGVCHFCQKSVQFILKKDQHYVFYFASLQSEFGQQQLAIHQLPSTMDSIVLIEGQQVYIKSTAALRIAKRLKGLWKVCYLFIIIPIPIRDKVYDFIAKHRYKWFSKQSTNCPLPPEDVRHRFLS